MEKEVEQWVDVLEFEGLYQISNMGNVRSLNRTILRSNGKPKKLTGIQLTPILDKDDYYYVILRNQGKDKKFRVNRLVAIHFIANPFNLPIVNHLKGSKRDNRASQLEWTTVSGNTKHSFDNGFQKARIGKHNSASCKVIMIDINSEKPIQIFGSIRQAARETYTHQASLSRCIQKRQETAGGYKWKLLSEVDVAEEVIDELLNLFNQR